LIVYSILGSFYPYSRLDGNAAGSEGSGILLALLCATPGELTRLLPLLEEVRDEASPGGTRLVRGRAGAGEVLGLSAGVGKVAAAAGARFLMDHYPLEALLVWGTAGALSSELKVGDLVISSELIPGDMGIAHSQGFDATGPGFCEKGRLLFQQSFPVQARLLERARAAADAAGIPYHLGKVLTCDQVVLDPELREHLFSSFGALAVEMEGAAAAQVASCEDLPFIAVRAISDEVTHDFVELEEAIQYKGQVRRNVWSKRFRLAVSSPSAVARAREFIRGMDAAHKSAASFLEAFLAAPGKGPE
jgi:adenosylhomocysteine nucleosidase